MQLLLLLFASFNFMETWKHTKLYIVFNIGDLWTPFGAAWKNVIITNTNQLKDMEDVFSPPTLTK